MKKITSFLILFSLLLVIGISQSDAKRKAAKAVEPVFFKGVEYRAPALKMGYIEAWDFKTKAKLREIQVYRVKMESGLEKDVQDVFISSLSLDQVGNCLLVKNEREEKYRVDLESREVKRVRFW